MSPAIADPLIFDLSGIVLRLEGLARETAHRLLEDWKPFVATEPSKPDLVVRWDTDDRPIPAGPFAPTQMRFEGVENGAHYSMDEGEVTVSPGGTARAVLARDLDPDRKYYAARNLVRAALAWTLPSRPALLVHAAGLVLGDRAFLLVGGEGAGKSTWAALGKQAGGRVISDDLVLVDAAGERVHALGAPFRSTHRDTCGPGRWPLAAVLLPRHGEQPGLEEVSGLRVRAALTANLPFIAETIVSDPRVARAMERLAATVPARRLTFRRDPSFVALLGGIR